MKGYSSTEVARMLGMSAGQVRSYVRSGFLQPARGARRALLFSFQDVVLLRTAKGLVEARIGPRKVKRILKELKERLPSGRSLASVSIVAEGNRVVIREGASRWTPDGQGLFDFHVGDLARKAKPIVSRAAEAARGAQDEQSAEDWYDLACHLELYSRDERGLRSRRRPGGPRPSGRGDRGLRARARDGPCVRGRPLQRRAPVREGWQDGRRASPFQRVPAADTGSLRAPGTAGRRQLQDSPRACPPCLVTARPPNGMPISSI